MGKTPHYCALVSSILITCEEGVKILCTPFFHWLRFLFTICVSLCKHGHEFIFCMVSGSCSVGVQSVAAFCSANRWSRHGKQTLAGYHKHADVRTPTFLTLFPFKGKTKRACSPSSSRSFAVTLVYLSSLNENRYVLLSAFLLLAPAFLAALGGVEPSLKTVN